jgi:hypothetical protein
VEAAGVEPASENASRRASTRVGTPFEVSRSPAAADLRAQQANGILASVCWRVGRPSLIVSVSCGYRRKLQAPSLPDVIRQREQQRCYRSQLHDCPFLRGQGRHDARPERQHPRRNRYAPMSKNDRHYGAWGAAGQPGQGVDLVRWSRAKRSARRGSEGYRLRPRGRLLGVLRGRFVEILTAPSKVGR